MGHEPVLVVADEQVRVWPPKESTVNALPGADARTDQLDQLILSVLADEHVLVRPHVPKGEGFPPRRTVELVGDFQVFQIPILLRVKRANVASLGALARPTSAPVC